MKNSYLLRSKSTFFDYRFQTWEWINHAKQKTIIAATPQQCFDVITDFEHYPDWASDIKVATIVATDNEGRGGDVQFRVAAMGRSTTYTLRYYYGSNPLRVAWRQSEGDITRNLEGEYEFLPINGGTETEVTYHLAADLAILIPCLLYTSPSPRD